MNFEELTAKINEIGVSAIAHEDFTKEELDMELVHSEGGHEGEGEYAERVFEHVNGDEKIYIKITGFYSSYHGTDWDSDFEKVEPVQKTITVYE